MSDGFGVIFDIDGVLVDSYRPHLESWQQAGTRFGVTMSEADFARTFGRTSREIIRQLWPGRFDDTAVAAFDAAKEAAYREILATRFPEMAGASALIEALHHAGFRLALGSSGPPENVALSKRQLARGDLIDAAVNGSEVKHGKPDPEVFLTAAGKLGLDPSRCAVVEDAPAGLQAARRAGMVAVGLTGTATREALSPHADHIVERLSELSPHVFRQWLTKP